MKVRLTDDAVRVRLNMPEIAILNAGRQLSVSAGGITVSLLADTHASMVSHAGAVAITVSGAPFQPDTTDPLVYSGRIEGTAISVELDLDTL